MTDPQAIATRYIAFWNEADPARRRELIAVACASDVSYVDPLMAGAGQAELDALVGAVHARFPGHLFALSGKPDGYADKMRFSWRLAAEGEQPVAEGTDFAVVAEDGRLRSVTGFLDFVQG